MLVDSIPHHVWSIRSDGSLGYWNRQLADYTGLTPEQLRLGGWQALHPDDVERVRTAWELALERGTSYEMEHRMLGSDGLYRRFMCRAVAVKGAQGCPVEWFGTNTDVEDRRRAEDAVLKLQTQLARAVHVTTLEEIAASISHEISQPLAAVIANAHACVRWLTRRSPDLLEAAEAATRVVRDARRASEVIARIRSFLRQEAPQVTPTDVTEVISEVVAIVQGEIRSHCVSLLMEADADLPAVAADRIQLQQVILNLVRNSIDAMIPVMDRARTLRIEMHRHDAQALRVAVCDSGIGLAPQQRERVFDAFHTSKPNGMGMGLAISRSIVEAHGGRLWATPNESHGETFHFTLPIAAR